MKDKKMSAETYVNMQIDQKKCIEAAKKERIIPMSPEWFDTKAFKLHLDFVLKYTGVEQKEFYILDSKLNGFPPREENLKALDERIAIEANKKKRGNDGKIK